MCPHTPSPALNWILQILWSKESIYANHPRILHHKRETWIARLATKARNQNKTTRTHTRRTEAVTATEITAVESGKTEVDFWRGSRKWRWLSSGKKEKGKHALVRGNKRCSKYLLLRKRIKRTLKIILRSLRGKKKVGWGRNKEG